MGIISLVIQLYVLALFAYAILSWVRLPYDSPVVKVQHGLGRICEPVLRPVRRIIPPMRFGGTAIDLSLLVVILVLELLARIL